MPYENELASKTAHLDILKNPDVREFLAECEYLTPPSEEESHRLVAKYLDVPDCSDEKLPEYVIATDGSNHETSVDDQIPSTKIGYIKLGAVLIPLGEFAGLRVGRFVDPFLVAKLEENKSAFSFLIPSANIKWKSNQAVRESFRALLDKQFLGDSMRFDDENYKSSLRTTLFHLASKRPGKMRTDDPHTLKIHKCPSCGRGPIVLEDIPDQQFCECGVELYPTDCLRLWEEVKEYQSNRAVMNRLMMVLEHLIPIHYIRYLYQQSPLLLSEMGFFIDGPLAVFGTAAWLHRSIMIFLDKVNQKLEKYNSLPLLIIGLQKSGQVIDHVSFVDRFLPNNKLLPIDDEYRFKYIYPGREIPGNGFGSETYYGQDFIYKTNSGRTFVFGLPYPRSSKDLSGINFHQEKTKLNWYPQLENALHLISHFESDLYKNAVVPIALAHRYTAISLQPGGQVLDLLTKRSLDQT